MHKRSTQKLAEELFVGHENVLGANIKTSVRESKTIIFFSSLVLAFGLCWCVAKLHQLKSRGLGLNRGSYHYYIVTRVKTGLAMKHVKKCQANQFKDVG